MGNTCINFSINKNNMKNNLIKMLELNGGKTIYTQTIHWDEGSITVDSTISMSEARKIAMRCALEDGYTIPKWWQFWRRKDTNISKWPEWPDLTHGNELEGASNITKEWAEAIRENK